MNLYDLARISADLRAVANHRAGRRLRNRAVGRLLGRAGFWRRLWR